MNSLKRQEGGCLCGNIRYQLDRDAVLSSHNCHCPDCQKSTGSGFATVALVPDSALNLTKGTPKAYEKTGESGGWVSRSFCPECGSQLFSRCQVAEGITMVKAGSLDDSDWLELASSFWGDTARPWAPVDSHHPVNGKNP